METETTHTYQDQEIRKVVTKGDLTKAGLWGAQFLQSGFSYIKMQGVGWAYALLPVLKKIHSNKQDLKASVRLHLEFYNNNPFLAPFVMGMVLAMEEAKEQIELIRGVKLATMGPLGGIGDALTWFTLLPITVSLGSSMALSGSVAGPFIFLLLFNTAIFALRYGLVHYGYRTGLAAVANMKQLSAALSHGASVVGVMVIGGLIATYVNLSTPAVVHLQKMDVRIQQDVLDKIMPCLLPLGFTLLLYYGIRKGLHPVTLIILTIIVAIIARFLHIL